jgi:hypothetical protein
VAPRGFEPVPRQNPIRRSNGGSLLYGQGADAALCRPQVQTTLASDPPPTGFLACRACRKRIRASATESVSFRRTTGLAAPRPPAARAPRLGHLMTRRRSRPRLANRRPGGRRHRGVVLSALSPPRHPRVRRPHLSACTRVPRPSSVANRHDQRHHRLFPLLAHRHDRIPVRHAREGFSPTGFIRHARRTTDKSLNVWATAVNTDRKGSWST